MFQSLGNHPKAIRFIAYFTYVFAFVSVVTSLITNMPIFIVLPMLLLINTAIGELYYHLWFVHVNKKKDTLLNVYYQLWFAPTLIVLPYLPLLKKVWLKIGEKCLAKQ